MCAARNAVGKSDIFDEPALRGTSGETGDSVNREAVFGDVSRPDVSGSEGIGDEPALSRAAAAEEERRKRLEWLETQWRAAPSTREWFLIPLLMVVSGFAAIVCTLIKGGGGSMALATAVLAPVVEETSKIIVPAMVLEKRPWRFSSAAELLVVCAFSGLIFATVENLLYFFVYIPKDQLTIGLLLCSPVPPALSLRPWFSTASTISARWSTRLSHSAGSLRSPMATLAVILWDCIGLQKRFRSCPA